MTTALSVRRCLLLAATVFALLFVALPSFAQQQPWMNSQLSPDVRADLVLKELTLDEKIDLLHGNGMRGVSKPRPNDYLGNGGAGFVLGVARLGIPMIQMSDAAYGVRSSGENGRYSTALPSNLAAAASWDTQAACEYGALIGRELRAQGYNMTLRRRYEYHS
jgi:beta-glucosidase